MKEGRLDKTFLLLDAASPLVQVGLWRAGNWIRWIGSREEAGRSLFAGVREILDLERMSLKEIDGFFFCNGPGSMLGTRIAAMAIQGWQKLLPEPLPIFAYNSHTITAHLLLKQGVSTPFHVISDARRQRWNVTTVALPKTIEPLKRLPPLDLAGLKGPFYRMEEIVRSAPPVAVEAIVPYRLELHADCFEQPDLLRQASAAEPLILEAPEYKKWSAERHR